MYKFKFIDLKNVLLLFNRQYWTINASGNLSILYSFLYACIYPLQTHIQSFLVSRLHSYNLAGVKFNYGEATAFLNYWYDNVNNSIYFNVLNFSNTLFISAESKPTEYVYIFNQASGNYVYINTKTQEFFDSDILICNIPLSLYNDPINYPNFIADLNTIILSGITYTIKTF